MTLPNHLWVCSADGDLCDSRSPKYPEGIGTVIREKYRWHHREIRTVAEFKATLRAGPSAWPGGYPLYFIVSDGAALSFQTARAEFRLIAESIHDERSEGWRVVACEINYEDSNLVCAHSGELIESAYGEPEESN